MNKNLIFVPITKVDEQKRLVYGIAASEEVDKANEIFDYETSKPNFIDWSKSFAEATDGKSLGNVRAMHGKVAAGRLEQIEFNDEAKQIEVCAKIIDDGEWAKVQEAVYTGFSIGGAYSRKWKDGDAMRYTAVPSEISIVDNPCVPSALFTMVKMDGTTEQRAFATNKETVMITNDMVAAKAKELAKAAGDESKWATQVDAARKALEAELEKANAVAAEKPAEGAGDNTSGAADNAAAPSGDGAGGTDASATGGDADKSAAADVTKEASPNAPAPDLEQVWKAKDGQTFKTKALAKAHNEELAAKEAEANDPAAKLAAQLAELSKSVDDVSKAKKADDAKDEEADEPEDEPEGDEEEDAEAKDKEPDPKKDKSKSKAKKDMEASAKSKKAKKFSMGLLKKAFGGDLKKGLDLVCCMARVIDDLRWLQNSAVWEAEIEGDNSPVPAKLKANIIDLVSSLEMITAEETAELIASLKPDTIEVLETSAAPRGINQLVKLIGSSAEPLKKAGARHSRADMAKLQAIHDGACELGAICYTDDQEVDPAEGVGEGDEEAEKLSRGTLAKALKAEQDKTAHLEKAITSALPLIADLQKRIEAIEDMPKPRPMDQVRVVSKDQDGSIAQLEQLAKDNPEALATTLIKLAQQQPRQMGVQSK